MSEELAIQPASDAAPVINADAPAAPSPAPVETKPDNVQKRIDKLTWEKNEYRRQLDELRARPESKPPASEPLKPPTRADHDYDEGKYEAALLEYSRAIARQEVQETLKREREQEAEGKRKQSFQQRQDEFIKSHPEYREKVLENDTLPITQDMARVIAESEMGPEVALYLAENEEKAAQIAQLSPFLQARELGRIEARLEAAKVTPPPAPKLSEAPPPVPKIDATDPAIPNKDPSKMSDSEFAKWRKRQIAQRR
jgi:hypothetical protein